MKAVIYDNNGSYYFLIVHNEDGWDFISGEGSNEEEVAKVVVDKVGLKKFSVRGRFDFNGEEVFLVEASMNVPVVLNGFDNYLWTNAIKSKIDEGLAEAAVEALNSL